MSFPVPHLERAAVDALEPCESRHFDAGWICDAAGVPLEDLGGPAEPVEVALVESILEHLLVYSRSFVWDHRGTETDEDRAALIAAVGWCSGWRGLLAVTEGRATW